MSTDATPGSPASIDPEIADIVDLERYPLTEPDGAGRRRAVRAARRELAAAGCSVLPGFVPAGPRDRLRVECADLAGQAHYDEERVNVYNTAPDPRLPDWHPGRRTTLRGNAFVARDRIPRDALIHRLYTSPLFQRFLADCLGLPAVYPLADPLAGLCVNVVMPGREHPWHFDTNEFAVSMITQEPEAGGVFEYCPDIRSPRTENFADVAGVLGGLREDLVRRRRLRPGDLHLFRGRYALHRVSEVGGTRARHSAIFAYSDRPGVVGTPERTRQLFGRLTSAHRGDDGTGRADTLLD